MLIQDVMSTPVHSVDSGTSLIDAYRLMTSMSIRHVPVMHESQLVGVVTDRDLRLVTSSLHEAPSNASTPVSEIMSRDPVTTTPRDPVEEAARMMRQRKIGCLPVVEDEDVVGIVTGTDLLDAIIRLTGLDSAGSRIAVVLSNEPGRLERLTSIIAQHGLNILSMLTYPAPPQHVHVILRINTMQPQQLVRALMDQQVEVVWPRPKPWSR